MGDRIRVVLADDEALIRDAVAMLLGLDADLEVVGVAASGTEAVALVAKVMPDVAVLDLHMPGLDGLEAAVRLREEAPGVGIVIVTSHPRPGHLKRALASGVRGFLPKTSSAQTLGAAIRKVAAGGRYVDPELAADAISAGDSPLTGREADVLDLSAGGTTIEDIAERAHLAPGTVRNYLSNAMAKLGATNRHEAERVAREHGWI